jgi:hypothetical protein
MSSFEPMETMVTYIYLFEMAFVSVRYEKYDMYRYEECELLSIGSKEDIIPPIYIFIYLGTKKPL